LEVLILHGIGGHAGIHWQQWLHDELEKVGCKVIMPDLPESDHPDRKAWLKAAGDSIEGLDPTSLIIVGHSLGVTTALDLIEIGNKVSRRITEPNLIATFYAKEPWTLR
jgi:predicted alpha/beta hydrolase family esterase